MGTSLNGDRFMTPRLSPLGGDYCTAFFRGAAVVLEVCECVCVCVCVVSRLGLE